jgi:hypothetical protein
VLPPAQLPIFLTYVLLLPLPLQGLLLLQLPGLLLLL